VTVTLVLAALVAVAAVLFVARPFLREPDARDDRLDEPGDLERRQLAVAEERDRALGALKELEFDHRTGKISDDDYRDLVGPLRRRAADALRALEPRAGTAATQPTEEASMHAQRPRVAPASATGGRPTLLEPPTPPGGPEPYPPQIPEPYPPPDEGTPPMPAPIPEPFPPPDEADPPRQI
jgi:hypothetical protein